MMHAALTTLSSFFFCQAVFWCQMMLTFIVSPCIVWNASSSHDWKSWPKRLFGCYCWRDLQYTGFTVGSNGESASKLRKMLFSSPWIATMPKNTVFGPTQMCTSLTYVGAFSISGIHHQSQRWLRWGTSYLVSRQQIPCRFIVSCLSIRDFVRTHSYIVMIFLSWSSHCPFAHSVCQLHFLYTVYLHKVWHFILLPQSRF